jgi:hypothetical protein
VAPKQQTFTPSFTNPAFSDQAFTNPISPPPRRRRPGKADRCGRRIKNAGMKRDCRQLPLWQHDAGGVDPATSLKSDLAFQQAMRWAIARGLEHAPTGVVKDRRPLNAPRLFEPVPHASGCTSPAAECADLVARSD